MWLLFSISINTGDERNNRENRRLLGLRVILDVFFLKSFTFISLEIIESTTAFCAAELTCVAMTGSSIGLQFSFPTVCTVYISCFYKKNILPPNVSAFAPVIKYTQTFNLVNHRIEWHRSEIFIPLTLRQLQTCHIIMYDGICWTELHK